MIVREHMYIVASWPCVDYVQVATPTRNYYVVHATDSYEALRRILLLEGVILYAHVNRLTSCRNVGAGYVAYYYNVVY